MLGLGWEGGAALRGGKENETRGIRASLLAWGYGQAVSWANPVGRT